MGERKALKAKAIYNRTNKIENGYVLIDGERVAETGTYKEGCLPTGTELIDLQEYVITPGFVDAHTHWAQTSLERSFTDVSGITSLGGILECIKNMAEKAAGGDFLVFFGLRYDAFSEKRYPSREELDHVAGEQIVFVRDQTGHGAVINSRGLQFFESAGMVWDQDVKKTGLLAGTLNYQATNLLNDYLAKEGDLEDAWMENCRYAMSRGITAAYALEGSLNQDYFAADREDIRMYMELCEKAPIEMSLFYQTMDVDAIVDVGLPRIGGCILADGAFAPHTAALYEPYTDDPTTCGILYIDTDDMREFVKKARAAGLQIAMHACGDAAIGQILGVYDEVLKGELPADHRCRIEHFEIPLKWQIEKAAELGVVVSMQPSFDYFWDMSVYEAKMGRERAKRKKPFRTARDYGIHLPVGSDSPVTPIYPLLGIQALVTNTNVQERISVREAIELFTFESAYGAFNEKKYGALEPGLLANLVVLGKDPEKVAPDEIKDIPIKKTMIRGKFTYSAE